VVAVDVAVVGGGIQGLVLLRELTAAGYGCVGITNGDLGSGQTLHSHGLLNSGTGLVTGGLHEELYEFTLPYLRHLGVDTYGEDRSFFLAPDPVVNQLAPAWEANRYNPQRVEPSRLPPGLEPVAPAYRVQAFNVDKRRLVAVLSQGVEPLVLRGEIVQAGETIRVRMQASGEVVSLEARAVVVAAGCGSKRLLRDVFSVDHVVLDRITYSKSHMMCLRAPRTVLPDIGTVVSPELIIVGHPSADPFTSHDRLVTWYVTPVPSIRPRHLEAPDNAAADVEAPLVRSGIDALVRLVPMLAETDSRIEATVFAGYKQDFGDEPTRRACELVDRERNVVMVLPSVLANAVPNAVEALVLIRQRLQASDAAPDLKWETGIPVGQLNENTGQTRWESWSDFVRIFG
jgi:glycine/D-amino acid oxidase-like deaminating enzyme